MTEDKRIAYSKKWFKRGTEIDDPIDKFIYLWIALVIAAQYSMVSGNTDRKRIINLFRTRRTLIFNVIKEHRKRMVKLAQRRGTKDGGLIVDTEYPKLREKFSKIVDYYTQGISLDESALVEYVGELLNKIRNNLFHGDKVSDDREDIELMNLVNPILHDVLEVCLF